MGLTRPGGKRTLDIVLSSEYVEDLHALSLEDLRERRQTLDKEEAWLSYLRRMLHGRIDILDSVIASRQSDPDPDEPAAEPPGLDIDALVAALSDHSGAPPRFSGRAPSMDFVEPPGGGRRREELTLAGSGLDDHANMSYSQLVARREELAALVEEVTEARSSVHRVHEVMTAELSRRYRSGEVSPDSVLRPES